MVLSEIRPLPLSKQVRDMLRDLITTGDLSPGVRLTETVLAQQLKVSRGPLREAILQLTEEGLLIKEPYKGLRVRSISVRELEELYSMRTTLEQFAFEEVWNKRTDTALADLRRRYTALEQSRHTKDFSAAVDGEMMFHSWVYELSDHGLLQDHWRKLVPLVRIYMSIHNRQHGVCGVFMDANDTYLNLARGDDLTPMLAHIKDHMQKGMEEVYASLEAS